jgi:hypothetical protein
MYAGAVDGPKIVAEIKFLEGGGAVGTKAAGSFERLPLLGLKKKHYLVGGPQSVVKNVVRAAKKKRVEHIVRQRLKRGLSYSRNCQEHRR